MNDDIKPDSEDSRISAGVGLDEPDFASADWVRAAIELHEGALLRYAQHFVRDLESARDIVQDTFLQLCRQNQKHEALILLNTDANFQVRVSSKHPLKSL